MRDGERLLERRTDAIGALGRAMNELQDGKLSYATLFLIPDP
jgi:hypothetical protein